MKVAGIITEYNPFHNGHKFHIEETKRVTGADYVIAVMSGNFVQRGTPAVIDKYSRTQMALNNGVDLVLELPVCYSTGSAEFFALGAVSLLDKLGIVNYLCFGSECGNLTLLEDAARLLLNVPEVYNNILLDYMKEGLSYPAARSKAVEHYLSNMENPDQFREIPTLLSEPNNILGIEYCKALIRLSSSITPVTIQRKTAHYHEKELTRQKKNSSVVINDTTPLPVISSATAVRNNLQIAETVSDLSMMKSSVPEDVYEMLCRNYLKTYPMTEEDYSFLIKYKLLAESQGTLTDYVDLTPDLADRILNIRNLDVSISDLTKTIKTRNITHTRINRALLHLLLNIKKEPFLKYLENDYTYYIRVLGLKKEASPLLRKITVQGKLPVITRVTKGLNQLDGLGLQMLKEDLFAAHLYNQAVYEKYHTSLLNEYKHGVCIL